MVCQRCLDTVGSILQHLKIDYRSIALGEIELTQPLPESKRRALRLALADRGFEVIDQPEERIVNRIKSLIIDTIHHDRAWHAGKTWSQVISEHLHREYSALSKVFSKVEGLTIEKFIVQQKIERAKELLSYREQSLAEIADDLHYSSSAHLSNQFKMITGVTPGTYQAQQKHQRNSIADL